MAADFKDIFSEWVNTILADDIPPTVTGYCFNLSMLPWHNKPKKRFGGFIGSQSDPRYRVELVGCVFNADNPDWPCDDILKTQTGGLEIPIDFSEIDWDPCLENMKRLISEYLPSNQNGAKVLNKADAVAIGFVDGDLYLMKTQETQYKI